MCSSNKMVFSEFESYFNFHHKVIIMLLASRKSSCTSNAYCISMLLGTYNCLHLYLTVWE